MIDDDREGENSQGAALALDSEFRPVGRPRSEAREQAIFDAALELLVEVGYDNLSMDALAERAHASKATIYRHWSGKAEVVAEAMRCRVATKHAAPPETGSLRGDLLGMVGEMVKSMTQEDGALVAGVLWAMRTDPVLAGLVRAQIVEQKQEVARATIQRAIERGELAATADPQIVAEVLPAMVFMRLLVTGEPLDEKFFLHVIDSILIPSLKGNV